MKNGVMKVKLITNKSEREWDDGGREADCND
jgi:hypothetical protein